MPSISTALITGMFPIVGHQGLMGMEGMWVGVKGGNLLRVTVVDWLQKTYFFPVSAIQVLRLITVQYPPLVGGMMVCLIPRFRLQDSFVIHFGQEETKSKPRHFKKSLPPLASPLPSLQLPWKHGQASLLGWETCCPEPGCPSCPVWGHPKPADSWLTPNCSWQLMLEWAQLRLKELPSCPIELRTIINIISSHYVWG